MQVDEERDTKQYLQIEVTKAATTTENEAINAPALGYSKCFDDDGRLKRTGKQIIKGIN